MSKRGKGNRGNNGGMRNGGRESERGDITEVKRRRGEEGKCAGTSREGSWSNGGRERGMEMPREHGRETYESEAALRALRGISQVAVSPIASAGFRPSVAEQWQRQARTTSGAVEFTVLASSFAATPPFSSRL